MADLQTLSTSIQEKYSAWLESNVIALNELTVEVKPQHLLDLCKALRDEAEFAFDFLSDVCGVDYLNYGIDDWQTESSTETGFSRGVTRDLIQEDPPRPYRFAVVYHLLSIKNNHRLRIRVNIPSEKELMVDSVMSLWSSADWFEREAFDLFGILFKGHPDLRRILTDYGFIGHPFRKDFPLIGKVEARYDAKLEKVVYEPVSIQPRVLEPKVIRHDHRYLKEVSSDGK